MAYVKQNWENLPSTNTPITAERLNHMEDGISEAWEHGGSGAGETLKIGTILPYTGSDSELPTGYMLCDGSELSRTDYSDLFAVIGTSFGSGNGSSTFNLPNLKGKVLTGLDSEDTDFASMGTTGGEKTHTLTVNEIPSHNHDFYFFHINATAVSSGNAQVFDVNNAWINTSKILSKGGSQPHNILQPYVVVNYIIKVTQSAPVQAQIVGTETESAIDGYSCNYVNNSLVSIKDLFETTTTEATLTQISGTYTIASDSKITVEMNGDGSIARVYGVITCNNVQTNGTLRITTPLRPSTAMTIEGGLIRHTSDTNTAHPGRLLGAPSFTINTDGTIDINVVWTHYAGETCRFVFINSLLFIK